MPRGSDIPESSPMRTVLVMIASGGAPAAGHPVVSRPEDPQGPFAAGLGDPHPRDRRAPPPAGPPAAAQPKNHPAPSPGALVPPTAATGRCCSSGDGGLALD